MPYERNRFFTGREDTLTRLAQTLQQSHSVAITQSAAISGMGGIGKTQTAVEYAYQNHQRYSYFVWMRAETETTLRESFVEVARLLNMREADEPDQNIAVKAVGNWLSTNDNWLLILDNADDLPMAHQFLPITTNGHLLYTTRAATSGIYAESVRIEKLSPDDGALLLLRRAKRIAKEALLDVATPEDRNAALRIAKAVDGLPLALDQAGAFIEDKQTSVARYLKLYETQEAKLLTDYGKLDDRKHASVAVTFSLAFEKAEGVNPAIGDLLRLCAFLAPDDIPELIFTQGDADDFGEHLGPIVGDELAWERLLGEACHYSLLSRDSNKATLSIHRLVQVVLQDTMTKDVQREWAERAIGVVCNVMPNAEFRNWSLCDQLLPQAQVCTEWIKGFAFDTVTAGLLLHRTAFYFKARAQYDNAEPLYLETLKIYKNQLGSDHPHTATSLNDLAGLYKYQGRYGEAEPLYLETLKIYKNQLGSDHPDTASSLNNLAALYKSQGRYGEAEPLYVEALSIRKRQLGSDHPHTATSLNDLAGLYKSQGRYGDAEPLYLEALSIYKKQLGSDHPDTATSLNNLAALYESQGRYGEAEQLFLEALSIRKRQLGSDHPDTGQSLYWLAFLYRSQRRYVESKPLYEQALSIYDKALGPKHPTTIACRSNYNALLAAMG